MNKTSFAMVRTSDASVRKAAKVDSVTAAVWLHERCQAETKLEKRDKRPEDQFLLAAQERPTRFRCWWQQQFFEGPSAGRDAEEPLRRKWLEILENLLRATKTPTAATARPERDPSEQADGRPR